MRKHRAQPDSGLARRFDAWRWRLADRRQRAGDHWDATAQRLRDHIPERPSWLDERTADLKWKLEEWRCRLGLWWVRRYEPCAALLGRWAARAAERLDSARVWALDRLNPVLWRIADLCRARAERAALRRAALAARIAELKERHVEPVVRKVENRLADTQAATAVADAVHRSGLSRWHLVACALALMLVGWAAWRMMPASAPELSPEELAMLAGFQRSTTTQDPTAWLREASTSPPRTTPTTPAR